MSVPDWLPGYERQPINAGHNGLPGKRKVILHTTEGLTIRHWVQVWTNDPGSGLPHFIIEGARVVQLLPLNTCAYTSVNGGIDANKAGIPIQVEICGQAAKGFTTETYNALGWWIGDLMGAGIELDLDACPKFFGPGDGIVPYLATKGSPVRKFTEHGYAFLNTIIGHQHLWGNDHWDPGPIDIARICSIARGRLGAGKDWFTMATVDELRTLVHQEVSNAIKMMQNVEGNLAGVTRGDGGETRQLMRDIDTANLIELEAVQTNLASVIREVQRDGQIPATVDPDGLAATVAARLTVTARPKAKGV